MKGALRTSLLIWAMCCILAALVFLVYVGANVSAGGGEIIMPLDDAYIHFQYASQIAAGQFYQYNPGQLPTSGATSFLYPYVLAVGHLIGFHDLHLGLWAMGVGAVALALSLWMGYRLADALGLGRWSFIVSPIMALHGLIAWHFMSGMETGLAVLFTMATVNYFLRADTRKTAIFGALLALTRPEGAILALLIVGAFPVYRLLLPSRDAKKPRKLKKLRLTRQDAILLLPVIAVGVQPLVNLLFTGSIVSSGNAAKSLFGIVPTNYGLIAARIGDNFNRIWIDLLLPGLTVFNDLIGVAYLFLGTLFILIFLLVLRGRRIPALTLIVWALAFALAISTLDTAFWHFRRYQMPLIALLIPFGITGVIRVARLRFTMLIVFAPLIAYPVLQTAQTYLHAYQLNVGYIHDQPYQMALWIRDNTPANATVAVHDVGILRYVGGRTTLDMVGLTTPGAAAYWRNGPGAIGEFLIQERPDYIASYGEGHGVGLGYLQDTDLYAETLATYTVALDTALNVALAAPTQGVYRPQYQESRREFTMPLNYRSRFGLRYDAVIDVIDVADLSSERAHQYQWTTRDAFRGFSSEFYQFGAMACTTNCALLDGGRRIDGEERFFIVAEGDQRFILITRLHAVEAGEVDIFFDDTLMATRIIPLIPGKWFEFAVEGHNSSRSRQLIAVRIVPSAETAVYSPYHHWMYRDSGRDATFMPDANPLTTYQDGDMRLMTAAVELIDGQLNIALAWERGNPTYGDYKFFAHVYAENDFDNVLAQWDGYAGRGLLPPGNWLSGGFRDTMSIDVSILPPDRYVVMIGWYHAQTGERLTPIDGDSDERFTIGMFEIP